MEQLIDSRLALSQKASLSNRELTSMTPLAPSLRLPLFVLFSLWQSQINGHFANLMSKMHFLMAILRKRSTWSNPQAIATKDILLMSAVYVELSMVLSKLPVLGFNGLVPFSPPLVFYAVGLTRPYLFFHKELTSYICSYMLTTSSLRAIIPFSLIRLLAS